MISVSSRLDRRTQSASSFGTLRQFHLWIVLEQFQAESKRQRMNKHRTIHILRALWRPLDLRCKD
jgi:hypothetical protein